MMKNGPRIGSLTSVPRRRFLKLAGAAAVVGASGKAISASNGKVRIVISKADPVASGPATMWAVSQLRQEFAEKHIVSEIVPSEPQVDDSGLVIIVSAHGPQATPGFSVPTQPLPPESIRIVPGQVGRVSRYLVSAPDERGLTYGLLELADRVKCATSSSLDLNLTNLVEESPANRVRSVARAFCSEIEDKAWYYDKDFWREYLSMLAAQRFNRFNFALGFGYDFPRGVTGDYFHFPYPYLVTVPGYDVRVVPLAEGERTRNLETLQFIAAETVARGMQFQLGIWTHAWAWTDSPNSDHHIEGLTAETHAPYCRDALAMLLKACPEIEGLTFRVHGESGVPEGSYAFWQTLFSAVANCGRKVEIDMHAKGINQIMIDMAAQTGMPVKVSAKSWAEHMGLGYHQADIRELEIPRAERAETGQFAVSNGERRFTRYGYADLFQEGRKFDVLFRLWPGTQRHLLWGDPELAAAYGRSASFCNAAGLEICEPLTFKGREGSGQSAGRCAYVDKTSQAGINDWSKFEYTYRIWGRLLYNPNSSPEVWRRYLNRKFGSGALAAESALANASRVLPLLTTAHLPSASNHSFWPEMYKNMPIVPGMERPLYSDSPSPIRFGTVSSLDPQLFSSIAECAEDLLHDGSNPKYSPIETAQWLEDFVSASESAWREAQERSGNLPQLRHWQEDIRIQVGLGRFFAAKLRSALLFEIQQRTSATQAGQLALLEYGRARQAWASLAEQARNVYIPDISYGSIPMRRGHWADRLPDIDRDFEAMRTAVAASSPSEGGKNAAADQAIRRITGKAQRLSLQCQHTPPSRFVPGQALVLNLRIDSGTTTVSSVDLYYRHVNQGERWTSLRMEQKGVQCVGSIPASYTYSPYPLQYYFVVRSEKSACFHPTLNVLKLFDNVPFITQ
ncbi:MAG: hypothetical protein JO356_04515 [Acidobacteria bacterium]|nr:hypothetical protein [Acidobacteriota bacterium]